MAGRATAGYSHRFGVVRLPEIRSAVRMSEVRRVVSLPVLSKKSDVISHTLNPMLNLKLQFQLDA